MSLSAIPAPGWSSAAPAPLFTPPTEPAVELPAVDDTPIFTELLAAHPSLAADLTGPRQDVESHTEWLPVVA